ncbi:hypothetical protein [Paenibacillus turpanensis]|uniref:hypothetical protein n=1 Tax=Paenibacillus turpanensis TaxID=2689078 RepID=UPI00140CB97F|nr:hypothetical protein [Paenibacillus turpanensis]
MPDDILNANVNNEVLNNRPPNLKEDFGITDAEDKMDRELMPNKASDQQNKNETR